MTLSGHVGTVRTCYDLTNLNVRRYFYWNLSARNSFSSQLILTRNRKVT